MPETLKEVVERVTARMTASVGRDWSYFVPSDMGDDLRTLLTTLSSQSATLEAMASALTVVRCMAENAAYNLHQMGISQETASPARAFEDIESQARTTLTQYRQGDL